MNGARRSENYSFRFTKVTEPVGRARALYGFLFPEARTLVLG